MSSKAESEEALNKSKDMFGFDPRTNAGFRPSTSSSIPSGSSHNGILSKEQSRLDFQPFTDGKNSYGFEPRARMPSTLDPPATSTPSMPTLITECIGAFGSLIRTTDHHAYTPHIYIINRTQWNNLHFRFSKFCSRINAHVDVLDSTYLQGNLASPPDDPLPQAFKGILRYLQTVLDAAEVCITRKSENGGPAELRRRYIAVNKVVDCLDEMALLIYTLESASTCDQLNIAERLTRAVPFGEHRVDGDGHGGGQRMFGHHCGWFWCYLALWTFMLGAWLWRDGGDQSTGWFLSLAFGLVLLVFLFLAFVLVLLVLN